MGLINGFARGKHFVIPAEKIRENERKIRSQKWAAGAESYCWIDKNTRFWLHEEQ